MVYQRTVYSNINGTLMALPSGSYSQFANWKVNWDFSEDLTNHFRYLWREFQSIWGYLPSGNLT